MNQAIKNKIDQFLQALPRRFETLDYEPMTDSELTISQQKMQSALNSQRLEGIAPVYGQQRLYDILFAKRVPPDLFTQISLEMANIIVPQKPSIRQKSIKIRLSEAEYNELKKQADGKPMASYMRKLCVSPQKTAPSSTVPHSTDPRLLLQLAGIGNNINQIARNLNIQLKTTNLTDSEVKKLDNTLQAILQELRTLRGDVC